MGYIPEPKTPKPWVSEVKYAKRAPAYRFNPVRSGATLNPYRGAEMYPWGNMLNPGAVARAGRLGRYDFEKDQEGGVEEAPAEAAPRNITTNKKSSTFSRPGAVGGAAGSPNSSSAGNPAGSAVTPHAYQLGNVRYSDSPWIAGEIGTQLALGSGPKELGSGPLALGSGPKGIGPGAGPKLGPIPMGSPRPIGPGSNGPVIETTASSQERRSPKNKGASTRSLNRIKQDLQQTSPKLFGL